MSSTVRVEYCTSRVWWKVSKRYPSPSGQILKQLDFWFVLYNYLSIFSHQSGLSHSEKAGHSHLYNSIGWPLAWIGVSDPRRPQTLASLGSKVRLTFGSVPGPLPRAGGPTTRIHTSITLFSLEILSSGYGIVWIRRIGRDPNPGSMTSIMTLQEEFVWKSMDSHIQYSHECCVVYDTSTRD